MAAAGKGMFSTEGAGTVEEEIAEESQGLLTEFIEYIKADRTLPPRLAVARCANPVCELVCAAAAMVVSCARPKLVVHRSHWAGSRVQTASALALCRLWLSAPTQYIGRARKQREPLSSVASTSTHVIRACPRAPPPCFAGAQGGSAVNTRDVFPRVAIPLSIGPTSTFGDRGRALAWGGRLRAPIFAGPRKFGLRTEEAINRVRGLEARAAQAFPSPHTLTTRQGKGNETRSRISQG